MPAGNRRRLGWTAALGVVATLGAAPACFAGESAPRGVPHVLWSIPFVLLLLAIAIFPLVPIAHHWWERNWFKLLTGLLLGSVIVAYYGFRGYGYHGREPGLSTVTGVLEHAILR